jgi:two-component system, NarL family, sensor kinase
LTKNEVLGKKPHDLGLIPVNEEGDEEPWESRPVPRAIRTRQPVRNELMGWKKPSSNETIWITGEILPILRDDGEVDHVVSSFSDVTERKKNEERLHQLSAHLLQLQDEERRRLGRELHDSLAQSVMAVNLDLAQLSRFRTSLSETANRAVFDARETLREMSREIRTLSYLLHPPVLDEMGLAAAVKEYAEGFSARSGIALELDLQPFFKRLPQDTETALFRIVQESLANIQKHSGSETAVIRLRADSGDVELEVSDRGRGFDKISLEKNGTGPRLGVGILGMRERMAQLGGRLDVESSSSGTTVRAKVRVMIEAQHAPSHLNS